MQLLQVAKKKIHLIKIFSSKKCYQSTGYYGLKSTFRKKCVNMQQTWENEFKNNYSQLNDILNLSGIKII